MSACGVIIAKQKWGDLDKCPLRNEDKLMIVILFLLQTIARFGRWLRDALHQSYLRFFKPDGLMAVAGWDTTEGLGTYFQERFCVEVPQILKEVVFPFMPGFAKAVKELGLSADPSMQSMVPLLDYLATVVVQDSLELAEEFPENPVHKLLLHEEEFM